LSATERNKGKRGERELARLLTLNGHPAHRGQQYSGGADSPDVICESLPFHFEVKRTERLRLHEAMNQATSDAGDMTPAVAHRRNRDEWLVTMRLSDLLELVA
jgi:Holliday junction resolvase